MAAIYCNVQFKYLYVDNIPSSGAAASNDVQLIPECCHCVVGPGSAERSAHHPLSNLRPETVDSIRVSHASVTPRYIQ